MTAAEFGSFTLLLFLLVATAHVLGHVFTRLRQPRVVGEILAGVLLGPSLLGHFAPTIANTLIPPAGVSTEAAKYDVILGFLYNLGLILLMFASGAETRGLFNREDRREVAWLGSVGTALPFALAMIAAPFMPLDRLMGTAGERTPLLLVVGIAVAVTSIPVISKILHDLRILHTRFARLVLGVAVLEDIALWAVLAVATALAAAGTAPPGKIALHVAASLAYFAVGLWLLPRILRHVTRARWNVLIGSAPVAYLIVILLAYSAVAAALEVSLVFAAFLAGYAVVAERELLAESIAALNKVAFAVFIPVYFAVVGYKLDLSRRFSFGMLAAFLALACAVKLLAAGAGARFAGFNWRDSVNLSMALNARGGPGIVLASVAYDAGIINAPFYTTLVLTAVLTSQAAGAWLEFVLRKGWPLLEGSAADAAVVERGPEKIAA